MRLDELAISGLGTVTDVDGSDDDLKRLMALGVCAGRVVELIQRGDPMILKVYGSRVGVSSRLAQRVVVEPVAAGTCPSPECPL